ncbi:elongation factor G [Candidatus Fermentibacterales bacterium]|nr:elongation factor G [Candidatus Fermentibacterales bacterium]
MSSKIYKPEQLRTIAVIGHGSVGKTSFCDAILFSAGALDRLGSVDTGTSAFDFSQESREKKQSLSSSLGICEWKGHKINVIDTPGFADFYGETIGAVAVSDGCVLVLDGVSGVEVGTLKTWSFAEEASVPVCLWVNRLDRENVDFWATLESARDSLSRRVIPAVFPVGSGASFKALVDVISGKALDRSGKSIAVPEEAIERLDGCRKELIEAAAETDEILMERFFENDTLTDEELARGLRAAVASREAFLLYAGLSTEPVGQAFLLDYVVDLLPPPTSRRPEMALADDGTAEIAPDPGGPFVARVFKLYIDRHVGETAYARVVRGSIRGSQDVTNTGSQSSERLGNCFYVSGERRDDAETLVLGDIVAIAKLKNTGANDTLSDKSKPVRLRPIAFPEPVFRAAIMPSKRGEEDKMGSGLSRLASMDPTFVVRTEPETGQTTVSGMGEQHLAVMLKRLREMTGVEARLEKPRIAYHETITRTQSGSYRHKKQTGGRGQYGHVFLRLEPVDRGQGYEFVSQVVGGNVPTKYIPAVEKGVVEAMEQGPLTGSKVVDVKAVVYDGSSHPVDSSDMAFKLAASKCFKEVMLQAGPILLEPVVQLEVTVPEEFMGDVIGDLNSRRGKILGMDSHGGFQIIRAHVPQGELYQYTSSLRSLTQARGSFTQSFSHYDQVPRDVQERLVQQSSSEGEE